MLARSPLLMILVGTLAVGACSPAPERPAPAVPPPVAGAAPPRDESPREKLQRACSDGVTTDCVELGRELLEDDGGGADAPRAYALFRSACDTGLADGCREVAQSLLAGDGVVADPPAGARLHCQTPTPP
ncbi:MAG: sel1 repeat family protein [Myxococcales bacterium]|nr:sel1 repeat family protein [Myxococcales bacterium]